MIKLKVYYFYSLFKGSFAQDAGRLCIIGDFNLPDFDWNIFVHPDNVYILLLIILYVSMVLVSL